MSDVLNTLGTLIGVNRPRLTPKKIILPSSPPPGSNPASSHMLSDWHDALCSYALHMQQYGTAVEIRQWDDMYRFGQHITDVMVDDYHVAFDSTDYVQVTEYLYAFDVVMMKNCVPCHEHHMNVGSASHLLYSWPRVQAVSNYRSSPIASEGYIQYQSTLAPVDDRPRLYSRRSYVEDILRRAFGSRLHRHHFSDRDDFLKDAAGAVACVHIGGAFPGSVDRTTAEIMTMGRCLVQNQIMSLYGGIRPVAGRHYVSCADDYSDLVTLLKGLLDNPPIAAKIGDNAFKLSKEMSPEPFWSRVLWTCVEAKTGWQERR